MSFPVFHMGFPAEPPTRDTYAFQGDEIDTYDRHTESTPADGEKLSNVGCSRPASAESPDYGNHL
jgi:hypothetical protein